MPCFLELAGEVKDVYPVIVSFSCQAAALSNE